MAVKYFAPGEHATGFVGYAVSTTIGTTKKTRTRYFSVRKYGKVLAKRLANETNRRSRAEATAAHMKRRLNGPRGTRWGTGVGEVIGLSVSVRKGSGLKNGSVVPMAVPIIKVRSSKTTPRLSTTVTIPANGGLEKAWMKASRKYREFNPLTAKEYTELRKRCPDVDELVEYLMKKCRERGIPARRKQLRESLIAPAA